MFIENGHVKCPTISYFFIFFILFEKFIVFLQEIKEFANIVGQINKKNVTQ